MGEISNPIMSERAGMSLRDKPSAARVPNPTAMEVEASAIMTEFLTAPCQLGSVKNSLYHCVEYPTALKASISGVNVKYGRALNDSGTITKIGKIRKNSTHAQMILNAMYQLRSTNDRCGGKKAILFV